MRYFIGNLIRGESSEYYKTTCTDLAMRFGIMDISTLVPPHMTIKAPFERNSPEMIDDVIAMVSEAPAHTVKLEGWNHFDNRTIFTEAKQVPPKLVEYLRGVLAKLRAIGLGSTPLEQKFHLHMSVARFLQPKQFEEVWRYLASVPKPNFDIRFDNLTIFEKDKDDKAWKVMKTFPLLQVVK